MSDFIRVRSADGPEDEYDAPRSLVEAEPERYIVVGGAEQPGEQPDESPSDPSN